MVGVDNKKLFEEITKLDVIPAGKLQDAYEFSKKRKLSFYETLLDKDLITDSSLGVIIADLLGVNFISLSTTQVDEKVVEMIPEVVARGKNIFAFKKDTAGIHIAMEDPSDKKLIAQLTKKLGVTVVPYFATARDLDGAMSHYSQGIYTAFDAIVKEATANSEKGKKADLSIVKIVETIIEYGHQNRASDIHIEPGDKVSLIRFRIDGVMHDIAEIPISLHDELITRVKVLSNLRTDEHQAPQDGKITFRHQDDDLDIRVSIVPVTDGEKAVMRLLSESSRRFSLSDLGLDGENLKRLKQAYKEPHGMILSTGPTGSGKTTTLYSILKLLNERDVNVMTIEDPVEYDIEGVNQIQVNSKTDLTFAKGLRSIVRQDPDIILVGEIRDEETADISINAAMTGHLVLSTLHTNDAATALPRLIDLGVEPFLVSSTVNVIIAQRLVRRICSTCRVSAEVDTVKKKIESKDKTYGTDLSEKAFEVIDKYYGKDADMRVYFGKGCEVCHGTGYLGRVGIFEVLVVNDEIKKAITEKKDASFIMDLAIKDGMTTMLADGVAKVKLGETTIEEVMRVTNET